MLPGFALPPSDFAQLNILYGSCRQAGHPDPDALAYVDDLVWGPTHKGYNDPFTRPHQLFLGGDQIYADSVRPLHMLLVMDIAKKLLAKDPDDPHEKPVEHVRVDATAKLKTEAQAFRHGTPQYADLDKHPHDYYTEPAVTDEELPVDRNTFPQGHRLMTTLRDAQLTSEDGASHVIGLGEFAALYLTCWSNALWGPFVTGATWAPDSASPSVTQPLLWQQDLPADTGMIVVPPPDYQLVVAGSLYCKDPERDEDPQPRLRRDHAVLSALQLSLAKVQRALANVPTYMILDDHDVTDDYFLNPLWCRRVLTKKLGVDILRNAMTAYALFQDWGNDPLTYTSGPKQQLLAVVPSLFPEGKSEGPDRPSAELIAELLGYDKPLTVSPDGRYDHVKPPLTWHFTIDGPHHRVLALDNRTRRSYASVVGPPGNVSVDALLDQIPLAPLPADKQVLVIVAPLQVIGASALDEVVAPLSYRVFDAKEAANPSSGLVPPSTSGLRGMLGTNPDAIEAWTFDTLSFEHLLSRLAPFGRVVLLSGDVHYSAGTVMTYWPAPDAVPARFAQFTSSGFKNVMPAHITFADRTLSVAQQLVRANIGNVRIGWHQPADDLVLLPAGHTDAELTPVMRSRLRTSPVLLPTWGWPDDNPAGAGPYDPARASALNPAKPFDWCWRVLPLLDTRPESDRPAAVRVASLDQPAVTARLADPATVLEGYRDLAARHQHALNRMRAARQILFRANLGRVRFVPHPDLTLDAVHEVITAFADPSSTLSLTPVPEVFLQQVAHLGPEPEPPPTALRTKALLVPDQGAP